MHGWHLSGSRAGGRRGQSDQCSFRPRRRERAVGRRGQGCILPRRHLGRGPRGSAEPPAGREGSFPGDLPQGCSRRVTPCRGRSRASGVGGCLMGAHPEIHRVGQAHRGPSGRPLHPQGSRPGRPPSHSEAVSLGAGVWKQSGHRALGLRLVQVNLTATRLDQTPQDKGGVPEALRHASPRGPAGPVGHHGQPCFLTFLQGPPLAPAGPVFVLGLCLKLLQVTNTDSPESRWGSPGSEGEFCGAQKRPQHSRWSPGNTTSLWSTGRPPSDRVPLSLCHQGLASSPGGRCAGWVL